MILFIDTSAPASAKVALLGKTSAAGKEWPVDRDLSETVLPEITKLMKTQKTGWQAVRKVAVVTGPGFFSRIRTGVVIANALAFALSVPVVAVRAGYTAEDLLALERKSGSPFVLPKYGAKPNITKAKKR